ncbi:GNAT family N-acetyltransferase [Halobaculum magnesiiphilum]|uniref:GNAT family N-acetyltransferase n=1 Tax=Halobaculum magnesiiphilum TaxID=1017351 RepID=A0A8T8W9J1_9EURY|nr:GNAT family N-acetyltransferase [Halobaculum magnesiiphilum]QZP36507.1 GNAT family N-acetyltransferase [Halobaculum magnesiiphilum]
MDIEVRPVASPTEFRAALVVNRAAWRDAYADILPAERLEAMTVPEGVELQDRYDRATGDGRTFLVAVDRKPGAVVGFADAVVGDGRKAFCERDDAELRAIYVDPDAQGAGVGSALLEAAVDRVPDACSRLVLETFTENRAAREFYEARGFERIGASAFEVGGESYPTAVYARPL